ncbi:hypothetical protein [Rhizobium sp.]|uniref:hypothetical protein n=1 Tax=Rhizobium sp. TaxID=391 RepID=UPI000E881793|nr:hypothetical protein [Rhizobium sp.]
MFQNVVRGAAALSLVAILAGCSTSGSSANGSGIGGLFGTSSPTPAATASAPAGAIVQGICPQVVIRDGGAYYRTYSNAGSKSDQDVAFQASLAETTRACTQSEAGMTVKAQVAGRLIAGPQGHAGTLSMPIRITVMDGDQTISTQTVPFSATLASADQPVQFLFTKDVSIAANPSATTQVVIGFDDQPQSKAPAKKTPVKKHK